MIISFNRYNGGGGSGSGVTPQEVQAQIDSALTYYWESGETKDYVDGAVSGIDLSNYYTSAQTDSAITAAVAGKADAKILVDFDHTTQAERAAVYAELKALYDGGSGATINKNYDFYKTVNTWQGQKIDYYTFSGDTLIFGQVVSPENTADQVVYAQVMTIDSAGSVNVVTNTVGGGGSTEDIELPIAAAVNELKSNIEARLNQKYYTRQEVNDIAVKKTEPGQVNVQIQDYVDPAIAEVNDNIENKELATSAALNELNSTTVKSTSVKNIWTGSQSNYDDIVVKDPETLYIINN